MCALLILLCMCPHSGGPWHLSCLLGVNKIHWGSYLFFDVVGWNHNDIHCWCDSSLISSANNWVRCVVIFICHCTLSINQLHNINSKFYTIICITVWLPECLHRPPVYSLCSGPCGYLWMPLNAGWHCLPVGRCVNLYLRGMLSCPNKPNVIHTALHCPCCLQPLVTSSWCAHNITKCFCMNETWVWAGSLTSSWERGFGT